jgi:hypothetical protein
VIAITICENLPKTELDSADRACRKDQRRNEKGQAILGMPLPIVAG